MRMGDSGYPQQLLDLTDPPPLLYILGEIGTQDVRADERARSTARTELPRTASSTPAVLVFGLLALALGVGVSLGSRARA